MPLKGEFIPPTQSPRFTPRGGLSFSHLMWDGSAMSTPESPAHPSAHHFAAIIASVLMFANAFPAVKVCLGALEGDQIYNGARDNASSMWG